MLKITVVDDETERRLLVEGKLTAPWVSELESAWNRARQVGRPGRIVVDLSSASAIDPSGKAALMAMIGEGARLTAKGVYSEYVVEELMNRAREVRTIRHGSTDQSRLVPAACRFPNDPFVYTREAVTFDSSLAKESSQAGQSSPRKERP